MEKNFKINVYFDEKSENVEKLIVDYILKNMNKQKQQYNNKKYSSSI